MYTFTNQFITNASNLSFLKDAMMGPNAMRISEELSSHLKIDENMRILDLGCGRALSTLLLTKKYGAKVFAADLWIPPTENYANFRSFEIDNQTVPISADATKGLPFADGYFDILFSVDSYHYFGGNKEMLPSLVRYIRKGGYIAIAIPGLKEDFGEFVPVEMRPFWSVEVAETIRSIDWWRNLWNKTKGIKIIHCSEMDCCKEAWDEWLTCSNPYAQGDVKMMEAEDGKYFNLIQLVAEVI